MNNIDFWKETELYPAVYTRVPQLFNWVEWRAVPRESATPTKWVARQHLDGELDRSGNWTTNIVRTHPYAVHDYNGTTKELVNWYAERNGLDRWDAIRTLAEACHLDVPHGDSGKWKDRQELNAQREQAYNIFYSALWKDTPEAHAVLEYLHGRGWDDEAIRGARLGLVTHQLIDTLPERVKSEFTADGRIGDDAHLYHLLITLRNNSTYYGYKVRTIKDDVEPRYLNTKGTAKGKYFYGLNHTKKLVLVEGELDALHAQVLGASNVVATAGGSASDEQVRDAIGKGVTKFTLLFDNDDKGREYIGTTIEAIARESTGHETIDTYVATFPDEPRADGKGQVKDLDDYLSVHSIDDFFKLVDANRPVCVYELEKVIEKYASTGALTYERRNDFFTDVVNVLNSPLTRPINREILFTSYLAPQQERLQFNIDDLRAEANRARDYEREKNLTTTIRTAQRRIEGALKGKDVNEAIRLLRETTRDVTASHKTDTFARTFASETPEQVAQYLSTYTAGVPTAFSFSNGKQYEPLTLNVGLTFVCGSRGHGKTSFLNSLALQSAQRNLALGNGQSVLYFSYEVQKRRIIADLLNAYLDDVEISRSPSDTILAYFAGAGEKYFYRSLPYNDAQEKYRAFLQGKDVFLRDYIASDAIKVVEENYKIEELLDAIDYYLDTCKRPVSTIYIDYAQLIFSTDYSRARTEEIKRIVNDIKDYANKRSLPFVLACQFNREVISPASVDTRNIGEGGDYERIADTCIGIYNLEKLQPLTGQGADDERKETLKLLKKLGVYANELQGELTPVEGKMFARLLKRRNGYYPLDTILDWHGRTKKVIGNDTGALYKQALDVYADYDDQQQGERSMF